MEKPQFFYEKLHCVKSFIRNQPQFRIAQNLTSFLDLEKQRKGLPVSKSTSLQRLLTDTTIKTFEDRESALAEAKKEAFNSLLGTYLALAYAYQWWVMSKDDRPYMEQKFKSAEIKFSELETTNFLIPTIKLIFDLNEPTYYSRVTEYALVLQYVDRMMDKEAYEDVAECPALAVEIIKDGTSCCLAAISIMWEMPAITSCAVVYSSASSPFRANAFMRRISSCVRDVSLAVMLIASSKPSLSSSPCSSIFTAPWA